MIKINNDTCNLGEFFNELQSYFSIRKHLLEKNAVAILKNIPEKFQDVTIVCDRFRVNQVLSQLIENAFKHAKPNANDQIIIDIKIKCSDALELQITNSIDQKSYSSERNGGVGLTNLQRRLELLYPSQHQLKCEDNNNYYITSLKINFTQANE